MTFNEFNIHLNSRFKSGSSQEHACYPYLVNLIRTLVPAVVNLKKEKVLPFQKKTGLTFIPEKDPEGMVCYINNPEVRSDYKFTFAPIDILDYIYAVLHSHSYRKIYKEFHTKDFPWVPYPKNTKTFWKLVEVGGELRQLHLLESPKLGQPITYFPVSGTNKVDKIWFEIYVEQASSVEEYPEYRGAVHINHTQYFADVPVSGWELYLGGYQPAQKWLNDRKGKILSSDEILHYQTIIVALAETNRLMKEVDEVEIE